MGDPEADTRRGPGDVTEELRPVAALAHLPVPLLMAGNVGGDYFRRSPALELEGEEAVVGADIEDSLAANLGPRQPVDDRTEVEHSRRHDPRGDLDRVVPHRHLGDGIRHGAAGSRGVGDRRHRRSLVP